MPPVTLPRLLCALWALIAISACEQPPVNQLVIEPPAPPDVHLVASDIELQPFAVRMSKLAHVIERPVSDPLFDALVQQRFALGDHDYARALRPDRRWSARKIGIWVKGLLPICRSDRFAELYPAVANAPDALVLRAYGRPADAMDQMLLSEVRASAGDGVEEDTVVCLALLSSLEFVAQ